MEKKKINFLELYDKIKLNIKNEEELAKIREAYDFAYQCHKEMKRLNGDEFITHPLTVVEILNNLNVDATTIISGLIHEVMETNFITYQEIEEKFGSEVATIVDSVTKINKL